MLPVIVIVASSVTIGFMAGYGVRAAVSHYRRMQARRQRMI
jgi:hypothetical protein